MVASAEKTAILRSPAAFASVNAFAPSVVGPLTVRRPTPFTVVTPVLFELVLLRSKLPSLTVTAPRTFVPARTIVPAPDLVRAPVPSKFAVTVAMPLAKLAT